MLHQDLLKESQRGLADGVVRRQFGLGDRHFHKIPAGMKQSHVLQDIKFTSKQTKSYLFSQIIKEKPEFLPEATAEVLRQLAAVLQTRQQEATALK